MQIKDRAAGQRPRRASPEVSRHRVAVGDAPGFVQQDQPDLELLQSVAEALQVGLHRVTHSLKLYNRRTKLSMRHRARLSHGKPDRAHLGAWSYLARAVNSGSFTCHIRNECS